MIYQIMSIIPFQMVFCIVFLDLPFSSLKKMFCILFLRKFSHDSKAIMRLEIGVVWAMRCLTSSTLFTWVIKYHLCLEPDRFIMLMFCVEQRRDWANRISCHLSDKWNVVNTKKNLLLIKTYGAPFFYWICVHMFVVVQVCRGDRDLRMEWSHKQILIVIKTNCLVISVGVWEYC